MADIFTCGVPDEHCTGAKVTISGPMGCKGHGSRDEAFRCMAKYLKSQGYERLGAREFKLPGDHPVLVLSKKSHFGQRMYYTKQKTRFMRPSGKRGHIR